MKSERSVSISVDLSRLEFRVVKETMEQSLAGLFRILKRAGDDNCFHPHPLSDKEARRVAHYSGKDLYYIVVEGDRVLGYGMLRGWDEGFTIPSLGIVIHPAFRNQGLGTDFVEFLHSQARAKGAAKVRLKVHPGNAGARHLYENLGYSFTDEEKGQLIGYCDL